jgi:hypothetical protein
MKKSRLALLMSGAMILAGAAVTAAPADDATAPPPDNVGNGRLSPRQVFEKVGDNYASLVTYSDVGQIVIYANGAASVTAFTTRLARPNFYRIEWEQRSESIDPNENIWAQAVWSPGSGNFLATGYSLQSASGLGVALDKAADISHGASAAIPMTFFKVPWGNELTDSGFGEEPQADEKLGKMDCYVFTSELAGRTRTLWIGKQDFLIHQIRTVISPEDLQTTMVGVTKNNSEITAFPEGLVSIETHTNIVINAPLSASDFTPSKPCVPPSSD